MGKNWIRHDQKIRSTANGFEKYRWRNRQEPAERSTSSGYEKALDIPATGYYRFATDVAFFGTGGSPDEAVMGTNL